MSLPPPERLHMRDRMPGTMWRAMRPLLIAFVVVAVTFTLFSVAVAITTADDCPGSRLNTTKEWNYFPPRWDCTVQTIPGQG